MRNTKIRGAIHGTSMMVNTCRGNPFDQQYPKAATHSTHMTGMWCDGRKAPVLSPASIAIILILSVAGKGRRDDTVPLKEIA